MLRDESGFSTPLALSIIFSLCILTLSFCLYTAASEKKINAYKRQIDTRKEADSIIYNIEKDIQVLKDKPYDADQYQLSALIAKECPYDFTFRDVSTGVNKNFMGKKFLESSAIKDYLDVYGEEAFAVYGWIHPQFADSRVIQDLLTEFDYENTFPLVNTLPPLNIHYMNEPFIKAVLEFCNIKNADKKAKLVQEKLTAETDIKELASLLEVDENHRIFDLVSVKTTFWQLDFETPAYNAVAVYAAVPDKNNQKHIEKYILIQKNMYYKRGFYDSATAEHIGT